MYIDGNTPVSELYHTDAELSHAWLKKGEQADNHKYIRREWKNGRWVYYYADGTSSNNSNGTRRYVGTRFKPTTNTSSLLDKYRDKHKRAVAAAKKKVKATGGSDVVETNNLLSRTRVLKDPSSGMVLSRVRLRGTLERAVVAGEAYIDYLFNGE